MRLKGMIYIIVGGLFLKLAYAESNKLEPAYPQALSYMDGFIDKTVHKAKISKISSVDTIEEDLVALWAEWFHRNRLLWLKFFRQPDINNLPSVPDGYNYGPTWRRYNIKERQLIEFEFQKKFLTKCPINSEYCWQ